MPEPHPCPLCKNDAMQSLKDRPKITYDCPKDGLFKLDEFVDKQLHSDTGWQKKSAKLRHYLYRIHAHTDCPFITKDMYEQIIESNLPNPQTQADSLLLYCCNAYPPGYKIGIDAIEYAPIIGAMDPLGVAFIIEGLIEAGLFSGPMPEMGHHAHYWVEITMAGWARFEELLRRRPNESRKALMAISGEDDRLKLVFKQLRYAVGQTNFKLYSITEPTDTGCITEQMALEIRRSRFLIADISHHNQHIYWQIGFAEGLGKPVFYTCNAEQISRVRFESQHRPIILWKPEALDQTCEQIKQQIRNRLPDEAWLEDTVEEALIVS